MPGERIVSVEWDDASYTSGYYDKKTPEDFELALTKTVGIVIKSTPKMIIVAMERFYNNKNKPENERHICTIPRKLIRKITTLREVPNESTNGKR